MTATSPEGAAGRETESEPRPGSGAMFDAIAGRYDLLNRILSLGLDQRWRRAAIEALACPPGGRVLDVATGTADMALLALRRWPGIRVDGIDPSGEMLAIAHDKARRAGLTGDMRLARGAAEQLPYESDTFDAAMIAFGIRNVPDRAQGLAEMTRVTRPGGRVVVLELTEPRRGLLAALARVHVRFAVPVVGALVSGLNEYHYLQSSIRAFPPAAAFADSMSEAGLVDVRARRLSFGVCHLFTGRKE